jgi:hypothetical protein
MALIATGKFFVGKRTFLLIAPRLSGPLKDGAHSHQEDAQQRLYLITLVIFSTPLAASTFPALAAGRRHA